MLIHVASVLALSTLNRPCLFFCASLGKENPGGCMAPDTSNLLKTSMFRWPAMGTSHVGYINEIYGKIRELWISTDFQLF